MTEMREETIERQYLPAVKPVLAEPVPVRIPVANVMSTFDAKPDMVSCRLETMEKSVSSMERAMTSFERILLSAENSRSQELAEVSNAQEVLDATVEGLVNRVDKLRVAVEGSGEQQEQRQRSSAYDISASKEQVEQLKQMVVAAVKAMRQASSGGRKAEGEPVPVPELDAVAVMLLVLWGVALGGTIGYVLGMRTNN